jgi:WD40 repeat protein
LLRIIGTDERDILSMAFSPDGVTIATGGFEKSVRLWNVYTGKVTRRLRPGDPSHIGWGIEPSEGGASSHLRGDSPGPFLVTFSPDGRRLAIADDRVRIVYDLETGRSWTMSGICATLAVVFSPDGRTLAGAIENGRVRLWNASTGKLLRTLIGHTRSITSVAFSPNGRILATGGLDDTLRVWDVATGRVLRVIGGSTKWKDYAGRSDWVNAVAFSPDGGVLASGSNDGLIRLRDVRTLAVQRTFGAGEKSYPVDCLAFSPSGGELASGGEGDSIGRWDLRTGRALPPLTGQLGYVGAIGFLDGGRTMADAGRSFRRWDLTQGREPKSEVFRWKDDQAFATSTDGRILAGGVDTSARLWDTATPEQMQAFASQTRWLDVIRLSPDGQILADASDDGTIRLWAVASRTLRRTLSEQRDLPATGTHTPADGSSILGPNSVRSMVFSPDGRLIATGCAGGVIRLWDIANGRVLWSVAGDKIGWVQSLAFSPDGQTLASGGWDCTVRLWDVATGRASRVLDGHASFVDVVAFSPDGRMLVSGGEDNTLRIWNPASGRSLCVLVGHTSSVDSVAFSPDGRKPASSSRDGMIKLWDIASGREVCTLLAFTDGGWAVTDPSGRFDGSDGGNVSGLHWVYDDVAHHRMEPIDLDQFASFYYTPGLLAKIWNREELPKVPNLQEIALYPELKNLHLDHSHVRADVVDRGGGAGDVHVVVNGIDLKTVPARAHLDVDLGDKLRGLKNPDVALYAYNAQNTIHSRAVSTLRESPSTTESQSVNPKIVAVVGSVQNYANPGLDLTYSDADAMSIAKAVLAMAKGLGAEVHVELVCAHPGAKTLVSGQVSLHIPDKAGFDAAFAAAAKRADADSVFLVYLAGHGAALPVDGGKANEYYYLTKDARDGTPASLGNPEVAKQWAVSGGEIREYLARALQCRRRFVVLDTCSAGASREQLMALRGESEDLARARREFQQGTGTFALMAAAEGKSSLEAAEYGHGLLTYALLDTLKNKHLGGEKSPDMVLVAELVAQTKSETRDLAQAIHRGQEPVAIAPDAGTVVLGRMSDSARASIYLTSRLPILLRPSLTEVDTFDTSLGTQLADRLREMSLRSRDSAGSPVFAAYLDEDKAPGAYQLRGMYSEANGKVTDKARVFRNDRAEAPEFPSVTCPRAEATGRLVEELRKWLSGRAPEGR